MKQEALLKDKNKDKDKEYLLARRNLSRTCQLSCDTRYCVAPENHACTNHSSTHTITQYTNGTIEHYMKTLSIPAHCPSVLNFKLLPWYPGAGVHILFTTCCDVQCSHFQQPNLHGKYIYLPKKKRA